VLGSKSGEEGPPAAARGKDRIRNDPIEAAQAWRQIEGRSVAAVCQTDNGRVLGYDNSHGFHHQHFMGQVETIKFEDYETLASGFRDEVRELWRKEDEKDR